MEIPENYAPVFRGLSLDVITRYLGCLATVQASGWYELGSDGICECWDFGEYQPVSASVCVDGLKSLASECGRCGRVQLWIARKPRLSDVLLTRAERSRIIGLKSYDKAINQLENRLYQKPVKLSKGSCYNKYQFLGRTLSSVMNFLCI